MVKEKYRLPDLSTVEKMNYKDRNTQLYDLLKNYKICVVPNAKIEAHDHLPHFMIIETSLKDMKRIPGGGRRSKLGGDKGGGEEGELTKSQDY